MVPNSSAEFGVAAVVTERPLSAHGNEEIADVAEAQVQPVCAAGNGKQANGMDAGANLDGSRSRYFLRNDPGARRPCNRSRGESGFDTHTRGRCKERNDEASRDGQDER